MKEYQLLLLLFFQGFDDLVDFLLKKGASPNVMSKNYLIPPIVLAGYHGYFKVIKVFKDASLRNVSDINFCAKDKVKEENVLHKVIKGESKTSVNAEHRDYEQCLDLLLEDKLPFSRMILPAVNAKDQMGNTPL